MKIVHLTPGTGNFYCGSCIRDNSLVIALRKLGHDVTMIPLYLPYMIDDASGVEGTPVFFGGINVYLQQKLALFRKTPRWIDRWFDSMALLKFSAKKAGMTKASELGEMTLSMLQGEEGNQRKEIEKLVEWLSGHDKPDLICLSNVLLIGMVKEIKDAIGVPVISTLQGEDGFLDSLPEPYRTQVWDLLIERAKGIDAFIAVSQYYGDVMKRRLQLPDDKVYTVYNGIKLDGFAPAQAKPQHPTIGYLARFTPVKGFDKLVDAFIQLKSKDQFKNVRLHAAGSMTDADKEWVDEIKKKIEEHGLSQDVQIFPNLTREDKIKYLQTLNVFSVPATYGESFGMYVLEAWAAGVPVVQPRHAAFVELIESTNGGLLYDIEQPNALAESLEILLTDHAKARSCAESGRKAVMERFNIDRMAGEIFEVYQSVLPSSS